MRNKLCLICLRAGVTKDALPGRGFCAEHDPGFNRVEIVSVRKPSATKAVSSTDLEIVQARTFGGGDGKPIKPARGMSFSIRPRGRS